MTTQLPAAIAPTTGIKSKLTYRSMSVKYSLAPTAKFTYRIVPSTYRKRLIYAE